MVIYSQKDPVWAEQTFSPAHLKMKDFGCTITCVAQALTIAGWVITPGDLANRLDDINGFTDDGLLIWGKVSQLFPSFQFGGSGFNFIQGFFGKYAHWILSVDSTGEVYEPYYGQDGEPTNFRRTGVIRTAAIAVNNPPTPELEPTPAPTPEPEVVPETTPEQSPVSEVSHTVVSGENLTLICQTFYTGLNSHDAYVRALKVADYNDIKDPNLIYPGQVIKLPIF